MTLRPFWGFNCPQVSSRLACRCICLFSVSELELTPQLHILFRSPDAMISSRASVFCCADWACDYTHWMWINLASTSWVKRAVGTSALHQRVSGYFKVWAWRRLCGQLFLMMCSASVSLWSNSAICPELSFPDMMKRSLFFPGLHLTATSLPLEKSGPGL